MTNPSRAKGKICGDERHLAILRLADPMKVYRLTVSDREVIFKKNGGVPDKALVPWLKSAPPTTYLRLPDGKRAPKRQDGGRKLMNAYQLGRETLPRFAGSALHTLFSDKFASGIGSTRPSEAGLLISPLPYCISRRAPYLPRPAGKQS